MKWGDLNMKQGIFVVLLLISVSLYSGISFPEKDLVDGFVSIPLNSTLNQVETSVRKNIHKDAKIIQMSESELDLQLKKSLTLQLQNLKNNSIYDEDFTLTFQTKELSIHLSQIKEYSLDFGKSIWNKYLDKLYLTFHQGDLYHKKITFRLPKKLQVLLVLKSLEKLFGSKQNQKEEIHYDQLNQIKWQLNNKIITYTWYPVKNIYHQNNGYLGSIEIYHKALKNRVTNYLRQVKNKLLRLTQ